MTDILRNQIAFMKVLKTIHILYYRALGKKAAEYNITAAQCELLAFLYTIDSAQVSTEKLLLSFKVSRATMSQALNKLRSNGFIIYVRDKHDLRTKYLQLTEKALEICPKLIGIIEEEHSAIFQGQQHSDGSIAYCVLEKMADNLLHLPSNSDISENYPYRS